MEFVITFFVGAAVGLATGWLWFKEDSTDWGEHYDSSVDWPDDGLRDSPSNCEYDIPTFLRRQAE